MARLTLHIPAELPFATELTVRVTDLNYGNHLANDATLGLLHEARVRFLRAHGMHEGDMGGTTMVLGDAALVYRAEAFGGDPLRIEVGITDVARVSCDFVYRITRTSDDRLVVEAKTGAVFLSPDTRRPTRVPAAIAALAIGDRHG